MKGLVCPINIRITNQDISSIIDKAMNTGGGSLHWCYGAEPKYNKGIPINEVIANGGTLLLQGIDGATHELTRDKLIIGLQQALPYLDNVINGINLDGTLIDGIGADLIVQLALFNELIYD
ncbi:hypothetical protein SAMN05443428_1303 [Caloramator quimbayensis]|uniref:Uncharacterized protein n=1 Tax=Caloramator quimbayensis TaxID=1147123 RepID=A0A1T4YAL6_9CLOT|nr:hypothetical protein [Caloramator quimbayensis]SKA98568.1 hypothetical protein SAMN05443428_1303 [Caloramator quimbayensis]